jgi:hypothetical protein
MSQIAAQPSVIADELLAAAPTSELNARRLSSTYRASQACNVFRLTFQSLATSVTVRPPPITAKTALFLCSATLISLIAGSVTNQPK